MTRRGLKVVCPCSLCCAFHLSEPELLKKKKKTRPCPNKMNRAKAEILFFFFFFYSCLYSHPLLSSRTGSPCPFFFSFSFFLFFSSLLLFHDPHPRPRNSSCGSRHRMLFLALPDMHKAPKKKKSCVTCVARTRHSLQVLAPSFYSQFPLPANQRQTPKTFLVYCFVLLPSSRLEL